MLTRPALSQARRSRTFGALQSPLREAGRVRVGHVPDGKQSYRRIAMRQAATMRPAPAQVVHAGTSAKTR